MGQSLCRGGDSPCVREGGVPVLGSGQSCVGEGTVSV